MGDRDNALTIVLSNLGRGTVERSVPSEDLVTPTESGVVLAPPVPTSTNVRLFEGIAQRRDGYAAYGAIPAASAVPGVFAARFNNGFTFLLRGSPTNMYLYSEAAATFSAITSGSPLHGSATRPYCFTLGPQAAEAPNLCLFSSEADLLYCWNGNGLAVPITATTFPPRNIKALLTFNSMAIAMNVVNPLTGNNHESRVQWSIVGDSHNWSALGSGFVDLWEDPFPIVNGVVLGGRMSIFKGGADGGAIYVATPTGSSSNPFRFDAINPGLGIGVLIPRSVVAVSSNRVFFIGHDAAYIYDGVRALLPFAEGVVRDIRDRAKLSALNSGFAVFNKRTHEVFLFVATGADTTPNEFWVFDIITQRVDGPHSLALSMLSAASWVPPGNLTWDTWGNGAPNQWDTLGYDTWDDIGTGIGTETIILGAAVAGGTFAMDETPANDAGTAIACTFLTPAITPANWMVNTNGSPKRLRADDTLTLRRVGVRHKTAKGSWIPVVSVSLDGASFTTISDGSTVTNTSDRLITKNYYTEQVGMVSQWFQVRVQNTNGDPFNVHSIILEFTYAGSGRHE